MTRTIAYRLGLVLAILAIMALAVWIIFSYPTSGAAQVIGFCVMLGAFCPIAALMHDFGKA